MKHLIKTLALSASLIAGLPALSIATAQTALDVAQFPATASQTAPANFPAHYNLNLSDSAAIEFWVKPDWTKKIDYDPILLSAYGPEGTRYAIAIGAAQDWIGIASGADFDFTEVDFTDGKTRHIAFNLVGDLVEVYVDGEQIDELALDFADLEITSFHLGTLDGTNNPFEGRLAEVRLWSTPLDPDDIAAYKDEAILSDKGRGHPDFYALAGVSDFTGGALGFTLLDNAESFDDLMTDLAGTPIEPDAEEELLTPEEEAVFEDDPEVDALTATTTEFTNTQTQ